MANSTVSSTPNPKASPNFNHPKRPPLLPSETAAPNNAPPPRRTREVNSRYHLSSSSSLSSSFSSNSSSSSSISSRRSQSPMKASRTPRRRNEAEEVSNAARVLMTSTRSLSVSFQGQSFELLAKPAPVKGTPERARVSSGVKDHVETVKMSDQYRWPGRSKAMNSSVLTKSLDFGTDKSKLFGSSNKIKDLHNAKKGTKFKCDSIKGFEAQCVDGANCGSISIKSVDSVVSDSDTVSSGSNVGGSVGKVRGGKRGIVVPARFLQDANSKLRKEVEVASGTPKSKINDCKGNRPSTPIGSKMYLPQTPVSLSKLESVSGRFVSPVRGGTRLASISKGVGTPVNSPSPRGRPSPTRTRNGMPSVAGDNATPSILSFNADMRKVRVGESRVYDASIGKGVGTPVNFPSPRGRPSPTRTRNGMPSVARDNAAPSILSYTADMRRVRVGESRVNDAHELRMFYNRQLQWRFINARAEAALLVQSGTAERSLYNAWVTISKLRHSIRSKRIQLQLLSQNLKLYSILKGQAPYLESWSLIDSDHCISLSEARQALQTSIANIPLVDGSRADIQLLKNAICSAADVMQGMTSSVGSQLIMVEQVSSLASELANTTASEISLIDQGKKLMSELNASQVHDCSLKVHLMQLPVRHQV